MKPLLSAPLTDEDIDIWVTVVHGIGAPLAEVEPMLRPFFAADRRDAELMWQAHKPAGSPWCLGCIAGPFCCERGKPHQCRLRVNGTLRDVT